MTQGRKLIEALKRKPMTAMELQMLGISICWHKRVAESLLPDERLDKNGLRYTRKGKSVTVYRVVKVRK